MAATRALTGLAVAVALAGSAARAQDAPIMSIRFGPDRLDVEPGQILAVEAVYDQSFPFVAVTLAPELQFPLASLTLVHVGLQGEIRICGRLVSEPVLQSALTKPAFIITNGSADETRRLAAILKAKDCDPEATS